MIPVILPVGSQTLSCIGVASAGVSVPFAFFLISIFYLLVPIWLSNFNADKQLHSEVSTGTNIEAGNSQANSTESRQVFIAGLQQGNSYPMNGDSGQDFSGNLILALPQNEPLARSSTMLQMSSSVPAYLGNRGGLW